MRAISKSILFSMLVSFSAGAHAAIYLDQGPQWTSSERAFFYRGDQGSRLIPYKWLAALREASGALFIRRQLTRYGFIEYGAGPSNPYKLPVGFMVAKDGGSDVAGMTCAACHTRSIKGPNGSNYVIDGGPAIIDFEGFMRDLDAAVGNTLSNDAAFLRFAKNVIGSTDFVAITDLKKELSSWHLPYHTLVANSLTKKGLWGLGRVDAFNMILNRFAGLDIGLEPNYIIPENMAPADVPVRYPFLWNASKQDYTQWPGTSINGNRNSALLRNYGEVLGVFAVFHPKIDKSGKVDYLTINSTNFDGLMALEDAVRKIGPPKWPWKTNSVLARQGETIFNENCTGCHGIRKGEPRPPEEVVWATPYMNIQTDTRQGGVFSRTVKSGIMTGVVGNDGTLIRPIENALKLSFVAVNGTILQRYPEINIQDSARQAAIGSYESRVLEGIWAAPPYLHNGSVSSMVELLKPAADRKRSFQIGSVYDPVSLGLAEIQPAGKRDLRIVTGCADINSGNSNCGHEFGINLSEKEKKALIEFLKTL